MATIYVAKSVAEGIYPAGNDGTGNGSAAAPYATIYKAVSVAAGGDIVNVAGSATPYAENWAGNGYMLVRDKHFSPRVTIQPWTAGDSVGIKGVSGGQNVRFMDSSGFNLINLVLTAYDPANANSLLIDTYQHDSYDITLTGCTVTGPAASTRGAYESSASQGSIYNLRFDGCNFTSTVGFGVSIYSNGCAISGITFINCTASGVTGLSVVEGLGVAIDGGQFSGTTGYGVIIGVDGWTGSPGVVSGYMRNARVTSVSSHSILIGAGADYFRVVKCDSSSSNYGLVVKANTGVSAVANRLSGGTAAILFKWANSALACDNLLMSSAGYCIDFDVFDGAHKCQNITVVDNRCVASGTANIIQHGSSTYDLGGDVIDGNLYALLGTGTWGTVNGVACTTLAAAKAQWAAYGQLFNDTKPYSRPMSVEGITHIR